MTYQRKNEAMTAPEKIWINKKFGAHPDDWNFSTGEHETRKQLRNKIEYTRADLCLTPADAKALVRAALDAAAERLEPKNQKDDWTDYAKQHHADAICIRAIDAADIVRAFMESKNEPT